VVAAGERVLDTPDNPISVAMTLATLEGAPGSGGDAVSFFGSMLFSRCVSGTRAVPRGKRLEVGGHAFEGYGAHTGRRAHARVPACVGARWAAC
jgi:O-phospho-L-seryl-tRNASec:L-selenocysteinyl-tRNA synthase